MLTLLRDYLAKRPIYFIIARKILELNFREEKKLIKEVFPDQNKKKILDMGCGTGEYSNCFTSENYTGIDISSEYIAYAKKTKRGKFLIMDATDLKFPNNHFDIVLIAATIHHLNDSDTKKMLTEAKRVLKKDGRILIMENAKIIDLENSLIRFVQKFDLGENIRTPAKYQELFSRFFKSIGEWEFLCGTIPYYATLMQK